jgi:deoxyguanosine kinase
VSIVSIVAIDGPTGVGKSTTARAVAAAFDAPLLLDPVSVSPLLNEYYNGEATPDAALSTELAFLRSRVQLLAQAAPAPLIVSDFSVMRTAPFAEFLDDPDQRRRVLDEMDAEIRRGPRIDVLVLLTADPASLIDRVRARARNSETELTIEHLEALTKHFHTWQSAILAQATTALLIDSMEWDPRRSDDVDWLIARISDAIGR